MSELKELFPGYTDEKIALYGLGTETEKALLSLDEKFEIVGLLDSFQETGEMYGKKILSLSQIMEMGVKRILVVARPGSCRAIARRIGDFCRDHGIALLDIRGKDLLERKPVTYDFAQVQGVTRDDLYEKIDRAEVVSFDLFDTLVTREVLTPTDLFGLVDARLKESKIVMDDFVSRRLEAEKRLSKYGAPTLEELYGEVLKGTDVQVSAAELAQIEWETDKKTMVARQAMCEIYESCIRQKKAVYLVTDTYYRLEQIEKILEKCHLPKGTGILASCEYGTAKTQKLFERLKEREGARKYLHIGDDPAADVEAALKEGMDTCRIFSGEELLDAVGNMGMETETGNLAVRLKAGMFAARLFNSPFQFEQEDKRIVLGDAYDIGYLICGPMITDFVLWFQEKVRHYGISNIWFCARDGYLLQKMYGMLDDSTETVYFQTSRVAAIRAGVMDEADISYVESMRFGGTAKENLKVRFGIELKEEEFKETGGQSNQAEAEPDEREKWPKSGSVKGPGVLEYKQIILERAVRERKNYNTYMKRLDVKEGDIAFFDFVAKGTTQMYVQRLTDHHLKGLYFLQLEPDYMSDKGLDIEAFYQSEEAGESIYDNYYVLETILTAPDPSVCGFDDTGEPVFDRETRSAENIRCFQRAQEGILDYFRRYLELFPKAVRGEGRKADEIFLEFIHNLKITDEDFLALVVEDPFFNRMTDMTELI